MTKHFGAAAARVRGSRKRSAESWVSCIVSTKDWIEVQ